MAINIKGVLTDPTGTALPNVLIRITSLDNTTAVANSFSKVKTGTDGSYDFNLVNGSFKIEYNQKNKYFKVAYVVVTDQAASEATLEGLISGYAYCEQEAPTCVV